MVTRTVNLVGLIKIDPTSSRGKEPKKADWEVVCGRPLLVWGGRASGRAGGRMPWGNVHCVLFGENILISKIDCRVARLIDLLRFLMAWLTFILISYCVIL